jgi:Ca2+-binding RTX toxin-like protein
VASDATTAGALTIGDATTAFTSASINLSADATNGGTIALLGGSAAALSITLGGTAAITVGTNAVAYDGTAGAVSWNGVTTVTALTLNAGASSGANTLNVSGKAATAVVTGGSGADTITGTAGIDTINGGAGADTITGGAGADILTGGTGADTFVLGTSATVFDTITDFGTGVNDTLDITTATAGNAVARVDFTTAITLSTGATVESFSVAAGGVVTLFDGNTAGAGTAQLSAVTSADMVAIATALAADASTGNEALIFRVDADGNGAADGSFVVAEHAGGLEMAYLQGTLAAALSAVAATGSITIA